MFAQNVVKISILITLTIDYHHVANVITVHLGKDEQNRVVVKQPLLILMVIPWTLSY